jgi:hypothetical protein
MFTGKNSGNFFDKRDRFAKTIPAFTIEGTETLGTSMGCLGSYTRISIFIAFACMKAMYLVTQHELVVTTTQITDAYGPKEPLNLEENGVHFAFTV